MIFIVGFAHSGTTFLCEVLQAAGYRFSSLLDHMEDMRLRSILFGVDEMLWRGVSVERVTARYGQRIRDLFDSYGDIDVVKQPSFVHCLPVVFGAGETPDLVILARRELTAVRDSLFDYGHYEKGPARRRINIKWMESEWEKAVSFLAGPDVPMATVRFPLSVHEPDEIPDALSVPVKDRWLWQEAWERCRKPNHVHFGG